MDSLIIIVGMLKKCVILIKMLHININYNSHKTLYFKKLKIFKSGNIEDSYLNIHQNIKININLLEKF